MNPFGNDPRGSTPQLNPADLYDKRRNKDAARLRAYNKILEQIYHRIVTLSKMQHASSSLLYTIPPFIFGLPPIDMEDCVIYLLHQLRHSKYEVRYTPPNMLYISWQHHEKSYLVEQSPIMQSMMESFERTQAELERKEKEAARLMGPRKSGRKVGFQAPGFAQRGPPGRSSLVRMGPPMGLSASSASSAAAPSAGPSASDYVPPTSFMQNMTNPPSNIPAPRSVPDYFKR